MNREYLIEELADIEQWACNISDRCAILIDQLEEEQEKESKNEDSIFNEDFLESMRNLLTCMAGGKERKKKKESDTETFETFRKKLEEAKKTRKKSEFETKLEEFTATEKNSKKAIKDFMDEMTEAFSIERLELTDEQKKELDKCFEKLDLFKDDKPEPQEDFDEIEAKVDESIEWLKKNIRGANELGPKQMKAFKKGLEKAFEELENEDE